MNNVKTDYSREIKKFLQENFEPIHSSIDEDSYTVKLALDEVYKLVIRVLPKTYIYESDVYEALLDLGFKNLMFTIPAKENEEGSIISPEKTGFAWFLGRKTAAL